MKKIALAVVIALAAMWGAWWLMTVGPLPAGELPGATEASTVPALQPLPGLAGSRVMDSARTELAVTSESASIAAARDAALDTTPAALRVAVTWSRDGSPAVGEAIDVQRVGAGDCRRHLLETDECGVVFLAALVPGRYCVALFRGGSATIDLSPGRIAEVALRVADGVDLRGRVLDGAGRPLELATIELSRPGSVDWWSRRAVARSAADGSFFIASVAAGFAVSARAQGLAPSAQVEIDELPRRKQAGDVAEVELVLEQAGGSVVGEVITPDGRLVAGAWVALGPPIASRSLLGDGSVRWSQVAEVVQTGGDGRFAATGVRADALKPVEVSVMADGYPIWMGQVSVEPGVERLMSIRLEAGMDVSGTVRDHDGAPVANAEVSVVATAAAPYLRCAFPFPTTRTGMDGTYRLAWVTPGSVTLRVWPPSSTELQIAVCKVDGSPGDSVEQDVTLTRKLSIAGRVVDRDGKPLVGMSVVASPEAGHGWVRDAMTDEAGQFEILGCEPMRYTVRVFSLPGRTGDRLVSQANVPGGERDLWLKVAE